MSHRGGEILLCKECKHLGDNCIEFFIWGGISSVLLSEITFYGDAIVTP